MAQEGKSTKSLAKRSETDSASITLDNPEEIVEFGKSLLEKALSAPGGFESRQLIELSRGLTVMTKGLNLAAKLRGRA